MSRCMSTAQGSGKMWAQLLRRDTHGVFSCQLELKIARDMFVCVSIAEARKKRPSRDIFPVTSGIKQNVHMCISPAQARAKKCSCPWSLPSGSCKSFMLR